MTQNWFPLPRAWVRAIVVVLLMAALQALSTYVWLLINWLIQIFPRAIYFFYLLVTFSPILLIAYLHHWFHQLLDQFFPDSRLPHTETTDSSLPGLMSWWEGFYGWFVNHLSSILSWAMVGVLLPLSSSSSILQFTPWSLTNSLNQSQPVMVILLVVRAIFAACFYQFETNVQHHLTTSRQRD